MAQVRLSVQEADGYLPAVCMCCGKPATKTVTKRMQWCPPWVGVLILAGLLPYAIVASILTRRAVVQAPFCDEHKGHWFKRNMLIWGTLFLFGIVGVGALVIAANVEDQQRIKTLMPYACVFISLEALVWIIIVVACVSTGVRPKEITDVEIALTGVSEQFVDAVAEEDRARKERRRQRRRERERPGHWRDETDDVDDDGPRRRRPTDDRIEE
jgi:hypothetical protein